MALLISIAVLALYGFLAQQSSMFSLISPRGGMLGLGLSLLLANAAIWYSRHSDFSQTIRFQLLLAGWIWLLAQLGSVIYWHLI